MKIQAFINDWDSPSVHACQLHRLLDIEMDATVLNAYDVPFADQWSEAVGRFTGDIFVWAMGDSTLRNPGQLPQMVESMLRVYGRGDVWMYAPNLDWTSMVYNRSKLTEIESGICEVPGTDLIFCSLHRELLEKLPPLGVNSHAWGYDYLMAHIAAAAGKKVVRDYNIMIDHPKSKVYSETDAEKEQIMWLRSLPQDLHTGVNLQKKLQAKLCV